jgi:hypothetical protein
MYTVYLECGAADGDNHEVIGRGLNANQAARAILNHDGFQYEIRKIEDELKLTRWQLWRDETVQQRRSKIPKPRVLEMSDTGIYSLVEDEADARSEIARRVIVAVSAWECPEFEREALVALDAEFDKIEKENRERIAKNAENDRERRECIAQFGENYYRDNYRERIAKLAAERGGE